MPENLQPETLGTWMRDLERRVSALERPKAVGASAMQVPIVGEVNPAETITSGTFMTVWEIVIPQPIGDAVTVQFEVLLSGTTPTAEVQLADFNDATDAVALSGTSGNGVRFDWAPPNMATTPTWGAYRVYVMGRYISGGGNMSVYRPARVIHGSSADFDADADGNGRIIY